MDASMQIGRYWIALGFPRNARNTTPVVRSTPIPSGAAYAMDMGIWGWIALGFAVVVVVAIAVMYRAVRVLGGAVDELVVGLENLRQETIPALQETRSSLKRVEGANIKADALLDVASSLTGTADSATKLAYRVVSNPFVKVLAFFTGTRRAASRLRTSVAPDGAVARTVTRAEDRARNAKLKSTSIDIEVDVPVRSGKQELSTGASRSSNSSAPQPQSAGSLAKDVSSAVSSAIERRRANR
jgi:hypothetical protein